MQFYDTILKPILENQIIVDWIAPIITGLILLVLPPLITNNIRNKNLIKNINLVNNKIIDIIRPFIIQRIDINSSQEKLDQAYNQIKEMATKTVEATGGVKILGNNGNENKA